jgi:hypothetical protein
MQSHSTHPPRKHIQRKRYFRDLSSVTSAQRCYVYPQCFIWVHIHTCKYTYIHIHKWNMYVCKKFPHFPCHDIEDFWNWDRNCHSNAYGCHVYIHTYVRTCTHIHTCIFFTHNPCHACKKQNPSSSKTTIGFILTPKIYSRHVENTIKNMFSTWSVITFTHSKSTCSHGHELDFEKNSWDMAAVLPFSS